MISLRTNPGLELSTASVNAALASNDCADLELEVFAQPSSRETLSKKKVDWINTFSGAFIFGQFYAALVAGETVNSYLLGGILLVAVLLTFCQRSLRPYLLQVTLIFAGLCCGEITLNHAINGIAPSGYLKGQRFKLLVLDSTAERNQHGEFCYRVSLTNQTADLKLCLPDFPWNKWGNLRKGDLISGSFKITRTFSSREPAWSYSAYMLRRGYQAELTGSMLRISQRASPGFETFLTQLHSTTTRHQGLAVILAANLGTEFLLTDNLIADFREAGLSHILVVSGFHIGLIYLSVSFLVSSVAWCLRWIYCYCHRIWLTTLLGGVCGIKFAALLGWDLTICRALVMALIIFAARSIDRKLSIRGLLSRSLCMLLVIYPGSFFEVSFQLTFAALAALLVAAKAETSHWLQRLMLSTTMVWLYTTPVVLHWFGGFSAQALLLNLVVTPILTLTAIWIGGVALIWAFLKIPGSAFLLESAALLTEASLRLIDYLSALAQFCGLKYYQIDARWSPALIGVFIFLAIFGTLMLTLEETRNED
ncbi:ComEC/Rec2 family competence protein [bacterium]|nr:ComEC/Rec2 family competence protein [bacterium]